MIKNYPNHRWQDVYRHGRIYREWYRLKPEYGEKLHLTRADISKGRAFFDTFQFWINLKPWNGFRNKAGERHANTMVALPLWYRSKYDYHDFGQHRWEIEICFLNVLYIQWHRNRDLDTKVALRFKKIFGRDVHPYARVQTEAEARQAASV